jgi:hypothetical protein
MVRLGCIEGKFSEEMERLSSEKMEELGCRYLKKV